MAYGMRGPTKKAQALANLIFAAQAAHRKLSSYPFVGAENTPMQLESSSERQQLDAALNFFKFHSGTKHLFKGR